jgi:hypothetical protein
MTPSYLSAAALTFVLIGWVLERAHDLADHWFQPSWAANNKGLQGDEKWKGCLHGDKRELPRWVGRLVVEHKLSNKWVGRLACAAHVAYYTFFTALAVWAVWYGFGLPITWTGFILGQVISAGTHYWADRRFTLKRLAERVGLGKFYALGAPRKDDEGNDLGDNPSLGTGSYALDQSFHKTCIMVAALVTAIVTI